MQPRFTKLDSKGKELPAEASEWESVLDNTTGLIWVAAESKRMTWKQARASVKKLKTSGFKDWRLPTVEELFLLADRSKVDPAIDTAFFPKCTGGWYWSSTPYAGSPGVFAWYVGFSDGSAYYRNQNNVGLVRGVRARQ